MRVLNKISKAERLRREERNIANKLKNLGIQYHKDDLKQDSPLNAEDNSTDRENRGSRNTTPRKNKKSPHQKTAHQGKGSTLLGWYEKYHLARFFKRNPLALATGYTGNKGGCGKRSSKYSMIMFDWFNIKSRSTSVGRLPYGLISIKSSLGCSVST